MRISVLQQTLLKKAGCCGAMQLTYTKSLQMGVSASSLDRMTIAEHGSITVDSHACRAFTCSSMMTDRAVQE